MKEKTPPKLFRRPLLKQTLLRKSLYSNKREETFWDKKKPLHKACLKMKFWYGI